jgi:hypothetical protein
MRHSGCSCDTLTAVLRRMGRGELAGQTLGRQPAEIVPLPGKPGEHAKAAA